MFFGKHARLFTALYDMSKRHMKIYDKPFNQSQKAFLPKLHLIDILVWLPYSEIIWLFLYIIQLMSIEHAMNKKSQIHNKNI